MCHDVPLGADRLSLNDRTVPLAELLLTKAQIVELTDKDAGDLFVLFHDHDLSTDDSGINYVRIGEICGQDWGLWRTVSGTLRQLEDAVAHINTTDAGARARDRPDRAAARRDGRGAEVTQMEAAQPRRRSGRSGTSCPRSPTRPMTSVRSRAACTLAIGARSLPAMTRAGRGRLPALLARRSRRGARLRRALGDRGLLPVGRAHARHGRARGHRAHPCGNRPAPGRRA